MNRCVLACALVAVVGIAGPSHILRGQPPTPAAPAEPAGAILNALQSHQVVGLGIGEHNNEQGHAFLLNLVHHPDFPSTNADLVVECGNARHQDVMDSFIAGGDIPYDVLRRAWQDTTQPHEGCDVPVHEELYRAVRAINARLPAGRRFRVMLGDPPIDWYSPTAKEDREKFMLMRDSFPAELIQREIVKHGRRAVVVYGQGHLQRKQMVANYDMSHPVAQTIVSLLERDGVTVFTVWGNTTVDLEKLHADVASWSRPSLVLLRGTNLGAVDFGIFFTGWNRFRIEGTKLVPIPREQWRVLAIEDQFDALLYLGSPSGITTARLSKSACTDAAYMKMRLARLETYGPKGGTDQLRKHCELP